MIFRRSSRRVEGSRALEVGWEVEVKAEEVA